MKPDVIYHLVIEFNPTVPFNEKTFDDGKTVKEIPVLWNENPNNQEEELKEMIWSLNPKNPVYKELLELLIDNKKCFKIMRTGEKKDSRYTIIKD